MFRPENGIYPNAVVTEQQRKATEEAGVKYDDIER